MVAAEGGDRGRVREAGSVRAMPELAIKQTPIPGLLVISLDVRADNRGWFKGTGSARRWWIWAYLTSRRYRTTCRSTTGSEPPVAFMQSLGTSSSHWQPGGSSVPGLTCAVERASVAASLRSWARRPRSLCRGRKRLPDLGEQTAYSYLVNDHWTPAKRRPIPSSTLPTRRWRSTGRFHSMMRTCPRQTRRIRDWPTSGHWNRRRP